MSIVIFAAMMTEELDFEAEIPVRTNVGSLNEVEYSLPNAVKKELVTEDVSDVGEMKIYKGEVKNHSGGVEPHTGEEAVKSNIEEVKSNAGEVKTNTGEEKSNTREVEFDTGEIHSDTGEIHSDTGEIHSDTGEIHSDTGEIFSDTGEIPDDNLEEGEIDEDVSVQNKTSEVACRFFQRGTCMYGSECRNPHVSNMVYNMFDPILSNRSNFKPFELPNFHRPPVFHPNPMPMMPDVESPWEMGIKKAKIVMQNVNLRKLSDDLDIENDWQRCLEEAQANIQNARFKRKTFDVEKPHFDPKYSEQEKFRERSPMKNDYESNIKESSRQKYSEICYSKYENESNYEKRPKPLDHLKWVDPWQRSKLPRKRIRSMSFSISPSPSARHSRNRSSVSSSSSSSSCFKHIYGSSHETKSPRKRPRSTSHSASPHSKKGRMSKVHTYSQKRSFSRSVSRTYSKSPRKRLYSGSSSSEHSRKSYVRKKTNNKKGNVKRVSASNIGKRYAPSERPKNIPLSSTTKSSRNKTYKRASSPSNSDSSSSSNLSASSLSCTSVSSISDINDLPLTVSETREEKTSSKRDQAIQDKKPKETLKLSQKYLENKNLNSSPFGRLSKELDGYSKQKKPSPDRSKLQMPSVVTTKSKSYSDKTSASQSTTSVKIIDQAVKPTTVKKETCKKPSAATMELLMYHSSGQTDDKADSLPQVIKPSQPKNISLPLEATKSKIKAYFKVPSTKTREVAPSKITPDIRSKSQPMKLNTCAATSNVKKEAASKRKLLLQQLQAIEDAIARKKQPAQ